MVAAARYADQYDGFLVGNPGFRLPLAAIANYSQGCVRLLNNMDDALVLQLNDELEETARQSLRAGGIIRHLREFVTRGETVKSPEYVRKLIEEEHRGAYSRFIQDPALLAMLLPSGVFGIAVIVGRMLFSGS